MDTNKQCACGAIGCPIGFGLCHCCCGGRTTVSRGRQCKYIFNHDKRANRGPVTFGEIDGEPVAFVPLSRGYSAIIDRADSEKVNQHIWFFGCKGYAVGRPDGVALTPMHRYIFGLSPDDADRDHRNGNRLDNRRRNLRAATKLENARNRGNRAHSSRYKGVSWNAKEYQWQVSIGVTGQVVFCGLFDDERVAAEVYDREARLRFGDFARVNFPRDGEAQA